MRSEQATPANGDAEVAVRPGFRITIPKDVRERLNLRPGQKLSVQVKRGVVNLIPVPALEEMRGFANGVSLESHREEEDEV